MQSMRPIAYTATPRFTSRALTPTLLRTEVVSIISNSTQIANAQGVQVDTADGGIVTLKGTVQDEDEARLIEGMIRLTPGVREVRNALKFPLASNQP
jgi:osmotically-inducible protein OsmY